MAEAPKTPLRASLKARSEAALTAAALRLQLDGDDPTTDALIAAGRLPGMSKFTLVSPAADIVCAPDEVAWPRSITVTVPDD